MAQIIWTEPALQELDEIADYISMDLLEFDINRDLTWSRMKNMTLTSILTCPHCQKKFRETMPQDSCRYFWECPNCNRILQPQNKDCCVYCSYGDTPCPTVQQRPG